MSREAKQKAYDAIKKEMSEHYHVKPIGFDKEGYLVGVATNKEELRQLIQHKKVYGVVVDNGSGAFTHNLETGEVLSEVTLTPEYDGRTYVVEQWLKSNGDDTSQLQLDLVYNNRFTMALNDFLDIHSVCKLDIGYVSHDVKGDFPMFRTLTVWGNSIDMIVTSQQMSFLTSAGLVKIHNSKREIGSVELVKVLAKAWNVDIKKLHAVITKDYSK